MMSSYEDLSQVKTTSAHDSLWALWQATLTTLGRGVNHRYARETL